ncbi:DsbA family oxidoreductase [Plantactinospora endophytica]|uniref:DSBA-like thioredoxin domain-containing protein n=1 Tax=Plantactinospora endophytica TaxID=673535 RepID=A0ABQ4DV03_9ACTN|nr:DsbA family protein [Plantactinospora endophytica]GIG86273.1 hypothetical protein Pen02_12090 [Plantactinospora endophytica]
MNAPRRAEVVLDFVCVHSYRGFSRFVRAARVYRAQGGAVETVFLPFQLQPDASAAGESLFEVWKRQRGEDVARALLSDGSFGIADGLELNFDRAVFANTFDAHRILAQASAQGKGEQMAERLFRAYFTDGRNLADPDTLTRLAAETGVVTRETGAAELRAELDRVRQLGVQPPSFRFEGGPFLEGEQSEELFHATLTR